jgi:hypothetical protein
MMENENALVAFEKHPIRRFFDEKNEVWYFSVVDVIAALTGSTNPAVYWRVLKKRLKDEGANETVTKCNALKMPSADGKSRLELEQKTGRSVVTGESFLPPPAPKKPLKEASDE